MSALFLSGLYQVFEADGLTPLANGKIYSYAAGTTTPLATALDADGTAADNPVELDEGGRPNEGQGLWLTVGQNYDLVIKDANDQIVTTLPSINGLINSAAPLGGSYLTTAEEPTLPGSSVLTSSGSVLVSTVDGVTTLTTSSAFSQKTDDYIAVSADNKATIVFTGSEPYQLFFDLASSLGSGWSLNVINSSDDVLTLDPSGSELINGETSIELQAGEGGLVVCSGAAFYVPVFVPPAFPTFDDLSPITTKGDIIIGDDTGNNIRLGIGTEGQVPTVTSGTLVYQTPAASGISEATAKKISLVYALIIG